MQSFNKLKILFVIDSLGSGGAQKQLVNLINSIYGKYEIEIFLYNPNSNFYMHGLPENISIFRQNKRLSRGFKLSVVLNLIWTVKKFDVVISFLPTANIYTAIACIFKSNTKHIACEMSILNETEGKFKRFLANISNRLANHVVCNSYSQSRYIESLKGMKGKVSTIWNGSVINNNFTKKLNCSKFDSLIIIGRVAYPKNGLRLLKSLDFFYHKYGFIPNVFWAGRDDSDQYSIQMKLEMIAFLKSHPHIHAKFSWLGEVIDVCKLYSIADAILSVSIYEGVPNVICEAMLNYCPVIASRISDNEIILGNGKRGFLCDPLSPMDICQAIEKRLHTSPSELNLILKRAYAYASENFSNDKMGSEYNKLVEKLIS
jgi:glycosyltransferase involved in cell wall biosynthesis